MNKSELVEAIAKETGVSKKDTEATLKAFVNVIFEYSLSGSSILKLLTELQEQV